MNIVTLFALSTVFPTVALSACIAVSGRERKASGLLLCAIFIVIALLTVSSVFLSNWSYMRYFPVAHLCNLTVMLIGPLFFLYVKSSVEPVFRFRKWHWLLFVPFIASISYFSYRTLAFDLFYGKHTRQLGYKIIESIQDAVYFCLVIFTLARNGYSLRRIAADFRDWRITWIRFLFVSLVIIAVNKFYTSIVCDYFNNARLYLMSVSSYFLFITLFVSVALFLFFNRHDFFPAKERRYRDSNLGEGEKDTMHARLVQLMDRDRLYLDPDLTLARLAERAKVSPKALSQVINERIGRNFNDFINEYRIKNACALLSDAGCRSTITEILYDSGFNSKSVFNEAFRKHTGKTPSEYRQGCRAWAGASVR
jgi:AraC-like DNA-binding protein